MYVRKRFLIAIIIFTFICALFILFLYQRQVPKNDFSYTNNKAVFINNINGNIVKYSVSVSDESFGFIKVDGVWKYDGNDNIKLNQTYVNSMVGKVTFLKAERIVEENVNIADLDRYGINNPVSTITIENDMGESSTIHIGAISSSGLSYYLMKSDSNTIYLVDGNIGYPLTFSMESYRVKTIFSIEEDLIEKFSYKNSKNYVVIERKKEINPNSNNQTKWEMTVPYKKDVNTSTFTNSVIPYLVYNAVDFVDDSPDDYSKYGLDAPSFEIGISTIVSDFKLLLGDFTDEGTIYAKVDNLPNVFTLSTKYLGYISKNPTYYLESFIMPRNIQTTNRIDFAENNNHYKLTIVDKLFYLNDNRVDEASFRDAFISFTAPVISGELRGDNYGRELCRYTFHYNTDTPSETVIMYDYTPEYAAVNINGSTDFYIKRSYVDDIISSVKDIK